MNTLEKRENKRLFTVMNGLFAGYIFLRIIERIILAWNDYNRYASSWGITEYMVNYQGGFVRRGLVGELLYQLSLVIPQVDPRWYMVLISGGSLGLVLCFFISKFRAHGLCWWILPLNVCLMGAYDLIRKDFLCAMLVIWMLQLFAQNWRGPVRCGIVMLLLAISLNVHECIFFMIGPILMLLFLQDKGMSIICRICGSLLPVAMMVWVCLHKGDAAVAEKIWNSWGGIADAFNDGIPKGTIASIGWDTKYALEYHVKENFLTRSLFAYGWYSKPILWCVVLIFTLNILFLHRRSEKLSISADVHRMLGILVFQFISLLPMFTVLSCDSSRICFYWLVSSFAVYFCIPAEVLNNAFPSFYKKLMSRLQRGIVIEKSWKIVAVSALLLATPQNYTSVPGTLYNSVLGTYVYTVVKVVETLDPF